MQLRIVAADRSHDDPAAVMLTATPQATALMPLAPVHLSAQRTIDGVRLSWIRRKRGVMPASWDISVPLGEDSEAYALDVLSGSSVVRTLYASTPNALYAAADEVTDFGGPPIESLGSAPINSLLPSAAAFPRSQRSFLEAPCSRHPTFRFPISISTKRSAKSFTTTPSLVSMRLVQLAVLDRDLASPPGFASRRPTPDRGREPDRRLDRPCLLAGRGLAGRRLALLRPERRLARLCRR